MAESTGKLKNVGGMWRKKDKNDKVFFSCNIEIGDTKYYFNAFQNRFKNEPGGNLNAPDYQLFVNDEAAPAPKKVAAKPIQKPVVAKKKSAPVVEDEGINLDDETQVEEELLD